MPASMCTNVKNLKYMQQTVLLYLQEKAEASLSMQSQGEKQEEFLVDALVCHLQDPGNTNLKAQNISYQ